MVWNHAHLLVVAVHVVDEMVQKALFLVVQGDVDDF